MQKIANAFTLTFSQTYEDKKTCTIRTTLSPAAPVTIGCVPNAVSSFTNKSITLLGTVGGFPLFLAGVFLIIVIAIVVSVIFTARSRAEKRAAQLVKQLDAVREKLSEAEKIGHFGSFTWDFIDPASSFWSEEMYDLFGLVPRMKLPTIENVLQVVHPDDLPATKTEWQKASTQPGSFSFVFRALLPSKEIRHIRVAGKMLMAGKERPRRMQGVAHDITREVQVDRAKSEFVSLASHQLKTPLTSIRWLSEALTGGMVGPLSPDQVDYVNKIHESNQRMLGMVNDLLNVSRIEMETLGLHIEDVDVHELAQSVLDEQHNAADMKHIAITLAAVGELPHIQADKGLARMILQNLISNAIKYTPANGSVDVELSIAEAKREVLFVRVTDTGIGIPKAEQAHMFEKLRRASNAQAIEPDGTGLGLYVVKTVIDRIGGGITFESTEGKGTTFYVSLPLMWQKGGQSAAQRP